MYYTIRSAWIHLTVAIGLACAETVNNSVRERETLTGEDATERVEMALVQPITSREQALKGHYRRGNYRIM